MWQTYITRWVTVSLINHRASLLCDSLIPQPALHYLAKSVRELLNLLQLLKLKSKSVKAISDKWSGLCPLSLPSALRWQSRRKSEGSGCETLSDARNRSEDSCWWSFWQQLYTNQGGCEVCECLREKSRSSFHKNGSIFPKRPPCGTDLSKIRQLPNILWCKERWKLFLTKISRGVWANWWGRNWSFFMKWFNIPPEASVLEQLCPN